MRINRYNYHAWMDALNAYIKSVKFLCFISDLILLFSPVKLTLLYVDKLGI